mgnify:CR=1 FL=1
MSSVTVRNLPDATHRALKLRAAQHGRSTEAEVQQRYAGQVEVQPHKYTDGHYLVITPRNPPDSDLRLVFETDGKKVETFRGGRVPQVCSGLGEYYRDVYDHLVRANRGERGDH